ncbi:phosphotransferase family protein [Parahaliea mediterranea]|uniref:Phosphotransferase family protein n=1 Tax=Parahaliea mediterranea TaxID=651086 RepID=A0A939DF02_9GAMM|nr:phosphotransferase family protein [Parahaliea mediterranea]MBN7796939.1 phosphotransferase family protein [Parahaliea mediterranea]
MSIEYPENTQRPTPTLSDPESVRHSLANWLGSELNTPDIHLSPVEMPEGNGMSNITVLFDITYTSEGKEHRRPVVGRIKADGDKLVFPGYDLSMQYQFMRLLESVDSIPSPILIGEDCSGAVLGTPFYLMEKTQGRIPTDSPSYHQQGWMRDLSSQAQRSMWMNGIDAMSRIHNLDINDPAWAKFIRSHDFPKNLQQQLHYWEGYAEWAFQGSPPNPACQRALAWLRHHAITEQKLTFCWGDARLPNVIYDQSSCDVAALLDWEMLTLGDPVQDLAWWIYLDELFSTGTGQHRLPGLPGVDESVQRWKANTGFECDQLHYYTVFAALRFALIFARIMICMGAKDTATDNFSSQLLERKLDLPQ